MVLKGIILGSSTLQALLFEAMRKAGGKAMRTKSKFSFKFPVNGTMKTLEVRNMLGLIEDASSSNKNILTFEDKAQRCHVIVCCFDMADPETWNFKHWRAVLLQTNLNKIKSVVLVGIKDNNTATRGSPMLTELDMSIEEFKKHVTSVARVNINVREERNLREAFYTATSKAALYEAKLKDKASNSSPALRTAPANNRFGSLSAPRRPRAVSAQLPHSTSEASLAQQSFSNRKGTAHARMISNTKITKKLSFRPRKSRKSSGKRLSDPFKTPLVKQFMTDEEEAIPQVLDTCLKFIMSEATNVKQIFRENGLGDNINLLKKTFARNPLADLQHLKASNKKYADIGPHDVSSLLKQFLSEMPGDPLINYRCYQPILDVMREMKKKDFDDVKASLKGLAATFECLMPQKHMMTVKHLCLYLNKFATEFVDQTKMTDQALAVCFAPVFFRRENEEANPLAAMADFKLIVAATEMLIHYANELFPAPILRHRRMSLRLMDAFAHEAQLAAATSPQDVVESIWSSKSKSCSSSSFAISPVHPSPTVKKKAAPFSTAAQLPLPDTPPPLPPLPPVSPASPASPPPAYDDFDATDSDASADFPCTPPPSLSLPKHVLLRSNSSGSACSSTASMLVRSHSNPGLSPFTLVSPIAGARHHRKGDSRYSAGKEMFRLAVGREPSSPMPPKVTSPEDRRKLQHQL